MKQTDILREQPTFLINPEKDHQGDGFGVYMVKIAAIKVKKKKKKGILLNFNLGTFYHPFKATH